MMTYSTAVVVAYGFIRDGFKVDLVYLGAALIFLCTLSPLVAFVFASLFKITLKDTGIHGHNFWSTKKFVRWADISDVSTVNLFGLKYLRVSSVNSGLRLWLPLFLSNIDSFTETLKTNLPSENKLREYFILHYG